MTSLFAQSFSSGGLDWPSAVVFLGIIVVIGFIAWLVFRD